VGRGGAGGAGLGSLLSSIGGGETARAQGVPSCDRIRIDTVSMRAARAVLT
jgi:hypothetical protein